MAFKDINEELDTLGGNGMVDVGEELDEDLGLDKIERGFAKQGFRSLTPGSGCLVRDSIGSGYDYSPDDDY